MTYVKNIRFPSGGMLAARRGFCGGLLAGAVLCLARASSAAETKSFTIAIKGGKVDRRQRTIRVRKGDDVRLTVTSDKSAELHLHGYDRRLNVTPGAAATLSIAADLVGRFPVTRHGKGKGHGHHRTLFYIEVHPD